MGGMYLRWYRGCRYLNDKKKYNEKPNKTAMKKILMVCLALVMGVGIAMAAAKPAQKKSVTTVFVTDIDCEHCVNKIMNNVPSLGKGIKDVQVDLPKKEVTVVYDASKNSDENIIKGFASLKVKAEVKKNAAEKR